MSPLDFVEFFFCFVLFYYFARLFWDLDNRFSALFSTRDGRSAQHVQQIDDAFAYQVFKGPVPAGNWWPNAGRIASTAADFTHICVERWACEHAVNLILHKERAIWFVTLSKVLCSEFCLFKRERSCFGKTEMFVVEYILSTPALSTITHKSSREPTNICVSFYFSLHRDEIWWSLRAL